MSCDFSKIIYEILNISGVIFARNFERTFAESARFIVD